MRTVRLLALSLVLTLAALAGSPARSTTCAPNDYKCWCNKQCEEYFYYCVGNCRYDPECGYTTCSDNLCACRLYTCGIAWPGCPTY